MRLSTPHRVRLTGLLAAVTFSAALLVSSFSGGQAARLAQSGTPEVGTAALIKELFLPATLNRYCSGQITSIGSEMKTNLTQIRANTAWEVCATGEGVIVAVLDTGVDLSHPDLAANLLAGIDYVDSDYDPTDQNGHGTHVAGIVGAGLNGFGVLGAAPRVKILPVRVLDAQGSGYDSDVADGIYYAVSHGAKVINMSLSGPDSSTYMNNAVQYAISQGVVVVAAAGNDYTSQVNYPASLPNVISVAAVDSYNQRAAFSNYNIYVDISAPGVSIFSTYFGSGYRTMQGTSMATPHVAGLAALVFSKFPSATNAQVASAIQNTALDLGTAGKDIYTGYGLVDAGKAVAYLSTHSSEVESQAIEPELEAAARPDQREAKIRPGRVLVQFVPGQERSALTGLEGVSEDGGIEAIRVKVLRVPPGREWETIDRLRESGKVIFAEPDYLVTAQ